MSKNNKENKYVNKVKVKREVTTRTDYGITKTISYDVKKSYNVPLIFRDVTIILIICLLVFTVVSSFGTPTEYGYYEPTYKDYFEEEFITNQYDHFSYINTTFTRGGITANVNGSIFVFNGVNTNPTAFANFRPFEDFASTELFYVKYTYISGTITTKYSSFGLLSGRLNGSSYISDIIRFSNFIYNSTLFSFSNFNSLTDLYFVPASNDLISYDNFTFKLELLPLEVKNLGENYIDFNAKSQILNVNQNVYGSVNSFVISEKFNLASTEEFNLNFSKFDGWFDGSLTLNLRNDYYIYRTLTISDSKFYDSVSGLSGLDNVYLEIVSSGIKTNKDFRVKIDLKRTSLSEESRYGDKLINTFTNLFEKVKLMFEKIANVFNFIIDFIVDKLVWLVNKIVYFFSFEWLKLW